MRWWRQMEEIREIRESHTRKWPTLAELQARLERITYKPGWSFELLVSGYPPTLSGYPPTLVMLRMRAKTIDVRPELQGRETHLEMNISTTLDMFCMGIDFEDWVYQSICQMEAHERDEWFRVDGVAPHDPHERPLPTMTYSQDDDGNWRFAEPE